MHAKSPFPSDHSAENAQVYCPLAYNATRNRSRSPRNSLSTLSSSSSSSLAPIMESPSESSAESSQNSIGNPETKRKLKNGFLKPAETAQIDFLVEKFKHRKESSKEGLTAANLKALDSAQ